MTLTDIVSKWLNEKWPDLYVETNIQGHVHVFDDGTFMLKVLDTHVQLANHKYYARCVCCSTKIKIEAADPELFNKIEAEINAWRNVVRHSKPVGENSIST